MTKRFMDPLPVRSAVWERANTTGWCRLCKGDIHIAELIGYVDLPNVGSCRVHAACAQASNLTPLE